MAPLLILLLSMAFALTSSVSTVLNNDFASKPNIIFVMADDQGWNNIGFHNKNIITPTINALVAQGIRLDRMYVYKFCSPTRSSFLSGRYPLHVNQENSSTTQAGQGVPINMTLIAGKMKQAGYATHQIGKWHIGQATNANIPYGRGFDSSIGYFNWGEDHYTQIRAQQACPLGEYPCNNDDYTIYKHNTKRRLQDDPQCNGVDLWLYNGTYNGPAYNMNGTYGGYIYTNTMIKVIESAAKDSNKTPFFVYLAFQNCHAPLEVPQKYINQYPKNMQTEYNGMTSFIDDALKNITQKLNETGLYDNTLIVYSSDNGGPKGSANNDPLKGYKFDDFEGGTRVDAFVSGGFLDKSRRGIVLKGAQSYMHIVDWYPTFCHLAGIDASDNVSGLYGIDGVNQWAMLSGMNETSARIEIPLSALPWGPDTNEYKEWMNDTSIESNNNLGYWCTGEGLIMGEMKIVTGQQRNGYQNNSNNNIIQDCGNGCLYNIINDPNESINLANRSEYAQTLQMLQDRMEYWRKQVYAPFRGPEEQGACDQVKLNGGYWGPWLSVDNCTYCI
eukprot:19_1